MAIKETIQQPVSPQLQVNPVNEIKPLNQEVPIQGDNFKPEDDLAWTKTELMKGMKIKQPLASAPTYDPKNFFEQVAFYNNKPYFNINNTWYTQTDGEYLSGAIQRTNGSTGDLTITCGFQPKMIEVVAVGTSLNDGYSNGVWSSGASDKCLFHNYSSPNWSTDVADFLFVVKKSTGAESYGIISSVSATGFTINFTAVVETINLIWKAYA